MTQKTVTWVTLEIWASPREELGLALLLTLQTSGHGLGIESMSAGGDKTNIDKDNTHFLPEERVIIR